MNGKTLKTRKDEPMYCDHYGEMVTTKACKNCPLYDDKCPNRG